MKSSHCVVAGLLAGLALSAASAEVAAGVRPAAAPSTIESSPRPAVAAQGAPAASPKSVPHTTMFAASSVPTAARLSPDSREERRFLREAAAESRFELEASRLALAKSGNSAVRSLATSMVSHQNNLGLELSHLLNARGMALPMLANDQRKTLNRLAKLNGTRFDAVYIQQVGLAQAGVAREYEKAGVSIREPQVNAWIQKTLPTTRYHLMLAERAAPADPRASKWNRSAGRVAVARAPVPASLQVQPRAAPSQGLVTSSRIGVQTVSGTRDNRLSASGSR